MLTKTKIAGIMVGLAALSAPLVYADTAPGNEKSSAHERGWHHGQEGQMMAKVLNLSADQEKQLKDLHQKQRDAMKATFEQMKTNREAFEAEIAKATPDMNKVNDLQNQLKTIQGQILDNHLNDLLAIKKVLTPEQFAGYMALKKESMMKKHMMMHRGPGGFDHKGWDGHKNLADKGKDGDEGPGSDE
jgi:Spy/CpxP family protein refolding chaperone